MLISSGNDQGAGWLRVRFLSSPSLFCLHSISKGRLSTSAHAQALAEDVLALGKLHSEGGLGARLSTRPGGTTGFISHSRHNNLEQGRARGSERSVCTGVRTQVCPRTRVCSDPLPGIPAAQSSQTKAGDEHAEVEIHSDLRNRSKKRKTPVWAGG